MNQKLAAVGVLLVFAAVAVGSGAFTAGDELTNDEANGSVFFTPADSPNGDAYAEFDDGEITVTIERLNPSAETLIDELFEVGYEGQETAEVWIEHGSESVTFYNETRSPVENEDENDRIVLGSGESAPVGMSVNSRAPVETLENITLVALIPTEEADEVIVSPPPGGGGELPDTDPETGDGTDDTDGETGADRSRLYVDLGRLNVQFREPQFTYATDVSDTQVGISPGVVGEGLATVVDEEAPTTEETITVEGTVENTGNALGTAPADLRVNGRAIESRQVELGPGENTTVDFALAFEEPGRYEVAVGDSEPVTVFVTEPGIDLFPWALVAAVLSLLFLVLLYRRLREEEEEEEGEDMVDVEE